MHKLLLSGLLTSLLALSVTQVASAAIYEGQVTKVADGDTLTFQSEGQKFSVRFAAIDAPEVKHNKNESNQPWGQESKKALTDKVLNKQVKLDCDGKSYNRKVCMVYLGNENINAWLVRNGHAWAYKRYDKTGEMQKLEKLARQDKVGIWSLPERQQVHPAMWRKNN